MKILITNSTVLNGGEAATVTSIIALVRRVFGDDTECIVYDQSSEVSRKYYPDITFRRPLYYRSSRGKRVPIIGGLLSGATRARFLLAARLLAAGYRRFSRLITSRDEFADLCHYASADLIISSGGTYLVDNYNIDARVFDYKVTEILGKPLVLFTQSIGPLEKPGHRRRVGPALERARLILLRDDTSLKHVRRIPVNNPNVHLSADAVFAMVNGHGIKLGAPAARQRRRVAISVRRWPYFKTVDSAQGMQTYVESVKALVQHLVQRNECDVCFVSTCQGIQEYAYDDSELAMEILAALPNEIRDHVSVDRKFRTPDEMIGTLAQFDLVVATRFHTVILALAAGVPTVGISYEFKTRELFAGLNIADWEIDLEAVNAHDLCACVDRCLSADRARLDRLSAALEREKARVDEAGKMLQSVVKA